MISFQDKHVYATFVGHHGLDEYEFVVEIDDFDPPTPARTYGPPEDCDPGDDGSVTLVMAEVKCRSDSGTDPKVVKVPWSTFLEAVATSEGFEAKPGYRGSRLDQADDYIHRLCYDACYEEWLESKDDGPEWDDDGW